MSGQPFEQLIAEAEQQPFSGWDFSYLRHRMREGTISWSYADRIRLRLPTVQALLDLGTGGGEVLSALAPLPPRTVATEAYPPNVIVARDRLTPLGVEVVTIEGAPDNVDIASGEGVGTLPFPDASFPLVIDRHESYYPAEVFRILELGGSFITQQVGGAHHQELNALLGVPPAFSSSWNLEFATRQLEEAGFQIVESWEEFPETIFSDIGAVVYYLKAIPWEVPGFTVEAYRDRLAGLHQHIEKHEGLRIPGHFFYLEVRKP